MKFKPCFTLSSSITPILIRLLSFEPNKQQRRKQINEIPASMRERFNNMFAFCFCHSYSRSQHASCVGVKKKDFFKAEKICFKATAK